MSLADNLEVDRLRQVVRRSRKLLIKEKPSASAPHRLHKRAPSYARVSPSAHALLVLGLQPFSPLQSDPTARSFLIDWSANFVMAVWRSQSSGSFASQLGDVFGPSEPPGKPKPIRAVDRFISRCHSCFHNYTFPVSSKNKWVRCQKCNQTFHIIEVTAPASTMRASGGVPLGFPSPGKGSLPLSKNLYVRELGHPAFIGI